ncbi:MAG: undecaprenyldiphospho-muramoylpentapeptide beta-N-acetylglucosaminyltransferase [bacterium]
MKIIISAGGTGGHIYPALAILDEFYKKEKKVDVIYVGTHNRMEKEIVKARGLRYEEIEIYGVHKTKMIRNIKNIFLIKKAQDRCVQLINEFKPDIVIGTGGYVIYPVINAAKKCGVTTFLHEQNSIPGKSNSWLSKDVDLIGVSFENTKEHFKEAKDVFYSGNPCSSSANDAKEIKKESLGLSKNKKLILIVSGSLGSQTINDKFKVFLKLIENEDYEVVYITGKSHYESFIKDEKFPKNVIIKPFIENLPGLMKSADIVISRAGASTISEILSLNLPSILIPSPYVANNHQYYNALDLKDQGLSVLIEEKNVSAEKLLIEINELLKEENYNKIKEKLINTKQIDSAELIYNKIKEKLK